MNTSVKTCIFVLLVIASAVACWQGIRVSANLSEGSDIHHDASAVRVEARPQINASIKLEGTDDGGRLTGEYSEFIHIQTQIYRFLRNETDFRQRWTLEQLRAIRGRSIVRNSLQIPVAVLDTGIEVGHEDLSGRVIAEINFTESATNTDLYGHGTHVAGIIAADGDNNLGIIGLAPDCHLLNVKVVNDNGRYQMSHLVDGIIWAVDNGAKVINISMVSREPAPELEEAVDYAWNNGAIIIAAAGNEGSEKLFYPAAYENCVAVTAIRENGDLVPLANYSDWVDVAAPGFDVYSTLPDNSYGYRHGTSFATAHISGLAALLFPTVTDTNSNGRLNDEVRRAIERDYPEIVVQYPGK